MYEIIFDFSASPVGGGLKRLDEYIKYFNKTKSNVLFLVHPNVLNKYNKFDNVSIIAIKRPIFMRLLNDSLITKRFANKSNCFFSYGIPIYQRMSKLDWFHMSNTLPFAYKQCTVSRFAKLKNFLLFRMLKKGALNPDIVSAESQFSLDLYSSKCGTPKETIILRNGVDSIKFNNKTNSEKKPNVLTVGAEGYKRLTKVFNEFIKIKKTLGLKELIIVGSQKKIPRNIIQTPGVRVTGYISTEELTQLYTTSQYYISASEIENSSVAIIEAVAGGAICFLSKIPAHLEMFNSNKNQNYTYNIGDDFFVADAVHLKPIQSQMWKEIIELMLVRINKSLYKKEL